VKTAFPCDGALPALPAAPLHELAMICRLSVGMEFDMRKAFLAASTQLNPFWCLVSVMLGSQWFESGE
jgi:hypothetical protein